MPRLGDIAAKDKDTARHFASHLHEPSTLAHPHRTAAMGNCFSDPSAHEKKLKSNVIGGSQKLGSGPPRTSNAPVHSPPKPRYNEPPRVLGGGTAGLVTSGDGAVGSPGEEDPRDRMRLAAEERAKSVSIYFRF